MKRRPLPQRPCPQCHDSGYVTERTHGGEGIGRWFTTTSRSCSKGCPPSNIAVGSSTWTSPPVVTYTR